MADNLDVRPVPFSSPYENQAGVPLNKSIALVLAEANEDKMDNEQLDVEDVYVVWFAFILGGWKALCSTTSPDGKYYEVTHNKEKKETYVDTYVKVKNEVYNDSIWEDD